MIFRQLFEPVSCTYTYVLASRRGGEALIIDPVLERLDSYIELFNRLELRLVKAVDTHVHADHITGLGALRDRTKCITVMGRESAVDTVSMRVAEGDSIDIEGVRLDVIYTPGHTDDSYSFPARRSGVHGGYPADPWYGTDRLPERQRRGVLRFNLQQVVEAAR